VALGALRRAAVSLLRTRGLAALGAFCAGGSMPGLPTPLRCAVLYGNGPRCSSSRMKTGAFAPTERTFWNGVLRLRVAPSVFGKLRAGRGSARMLRISVGTLMRDAARVELTTGVHSRTAHGRLAGSRAAVCADSKRGDGQRARSSRSGGHSVWHIAMSERTLLR